MSRLILPHVRGIFSANPAAHAGPGACGCTPALLEGDRRATMTVTKDGFAWDAGIDERLIDGSLVNNSTGAVDVPASFPNGCGIVCTKAVNFLVNQIKASALGAFDFGIWCVKQGGQTSATFSLDGTTSVTRNITGLTLGGIDARLEKVGDHSPTNTWWHEIAYSECDC